MRFLSKRHIHVFCKHPRKLEIKSVGDISDDTFYHTFVTLREREAVFAQVSAAASN